MLSDSPIVPRRTLRLLAPAAWVLPACLTIAGLSSALARADFYLHPLEGHYERAKQSTLGVDLSYFSSTQNYDNAGTVFIPTGFEKYSRTQMDVSGSYGFTPRLTGFARLSWARVQVNAAQEGSSFGFTDQTVGMTARLLGLSKAPKTNDESPESIGPSLDAQFRLDFPLYSNVTAETNQTPFLGDGSVDGTIALLVNYPIAVGEATTMTLGAGAGYTRRSSDFSSAVPWNATVAFTPLREGFFAGAGVYGIQSLKTDPRGIGVTSQTPSTGATSMGTGGSYMSNAINPSLVSVRADVGYQLDRLAFSGTLGQSIHGVSAPAGTYVAFGVTGRFGQAARKGFEGNSAEYGKSNRGFLDYTLDAHVTRFSDRLGQLKIDTGSDQGVESGQTFDLFMPKRNGKPGEPVARAQVVESKSGEATLKVLEYFREVLIDEGFIAKRVPTP